MPPNLLVVPPALSGDERRTVPLEADRALTVGRSSACEVRLNDPRVSARHARLRAAAGQLLVEDLGSLNGTFIVRGGERRAVAAGAEVPVESGAAVEIGPYTLHACEELAQDVLLAGGDRVEVEPADLPAGELADRVVAALGSFAGAAGGDAWSRVLAGVLQLARPRRAFLLSVDEERFVLRASGGAPGAACLSRGFLDAVLARDDRGPVKRAPAATPLSTTLRALGDDVALAGARFPGTAGQVVAIAYLELERPLAAADAAALASYARVSGPLLETALALDVESRRREALEASLRRERARVPDPGSAAPARALIGESPAFLAALEVVRRAAPTRATILVRGPSGSGKEELARLAHEASPRRDKPFVVLNAAAIPEALAESELFGHERGAFTGADVARAGAFERADGGTIFLDEIGELPLALQPKILRALETGEIARVGGARRRVDVRLVAATHRDLEAMVASGAFRADLYFRLRVVEAVLPPLAERPEDVAALAQAFLSRFPRADGGTLSGIAAGALRALGRYGWPGNVRELRNVIERAAVLDRDGVLDLDDLPPDIAAAAGGGARGGSEALLALPWPAARDRFEALYFGSALERHGGRVQETAVATGVDRRTLSTKIRQHGLRKNREG
ncbi:MAG: sigma 54-interacting transcriptional regulator [Acidobacteria bacterium]|nr:sigma 54-interacting transcriptional regulator [Acidobacteriota bacterium]